MNTGAIAIDLDELLDPERFAPHRSRPLVEGSFT